MLSSGCTAFVFSLPVIVAVLLVILVVVLKAVFKKKLLIRCIPSKRARKFQRRVLEASQPRRHAVEAVVDCAGAKARRYLAAHLRSLNEVPAVLGVNVVVILSE